MKTDPEAFLKAMVAYPLPADNSDRLLASRL